MVRLTGTHTPKWGRSGAAALFGTLEFQVQVASKIPGPDYDVDRGHRVMGTIKFGGGTKKSYVDEICYQKKDVPGPNTYPLPPPMDSIKGGRISQSRTLSFCDEAARQ
eukprot:CAMPEP_0206263388 /NCGR_PEP_ID=MMETSP0047_2-20121206/28790_1 /ASSEMBLY_ACC=CAM_ASM_000192 /TAXON_ID=195065 /ORGANISM="Chroomonas mesostigmatica_cf, Strain CCMP1168" /LENGTH=107 /DNA_ID=CAMNT_0053690923 /DNA_START=171 /DNA_END=491 /DNA_ORIENTATION=-